MQRRRSKTVRSAASWICLAAWCSTPAFADAYYDQGVALYNKRDFRNAIRYFEASVSNAPWDGKAAYYAALTWHQMKQLPKAKQSYKLVIDRFPGSNEAVMAERALRSIDPNWKPVSRTAGAGAGSAATTSVGEASSSADFASLPNQTKISFRKERLEGPSEDNQNEALMVDGQVNGRSTKMIFDTGYDGALFGKGDLERLSIYLPPGASFSMAKGYGTEKQVKTWKMNVDLKLGQILRKGFPITVQDEYKAPPRLGHSFYKDYAYTIDYNASQIDFHKKGGRSASSHQDLYAVPFTRRGNNILVQVEINGRQTQMCFDTAASGCTFTEKQARAAGITVPEEADPSPGGEGFDRFSLYNEPAGGAGQKKTKTSAVRRMKLGPVDKSDVSIEIVEKSPSEYPLLGQSFYSGWQYTIDNANNVIRFVRR